MKKTHNKKAKPTPERGWPYATVRQLEKLANSHRVLETKVMGIAADLDDHNIVAALNRIEKAIREGGSGGSGGITQEMLDDLTRKVLANKEKIHDAQEATEKES
jgi:hypothetical protein